MSIPKGNMKISGSVIEALSARGTIAVGAPLSCFTTYRTGGNADLLIEPVTREDIPAIVAIVRHEGLPLTVIGGGSNLLVGDGGIEGIVLRLCESEHNRPVIRILDDGSICADAIAAKERFVSFAVEAGFRGIEFMAGIPGCVGGGVMMNAGTATGSFADILSEVDIVTTEGDQRTVAVKKEMFSYRTIDIEEGCIVTRGCFTLPRAEEPSMTRAAIDEILADRRMKHPLDYPSAGSVFKNPPGHSSWKLVDDAGLKGRSIGGARVSDLHTNFIINAGGAKSRDILDLIHVIQETVWARFGVKLETEIKTIGVF